MQGTGISLCVAFHHRGHHMKISVRSCITRQVFLTSPPLSLHLSMMGVTCRTCNCKAFWNTTTDLTLFTLKLFQLPHATRISTRSLVHSWFFRIHYLSNHSPLYSNSIQRAFCMRWEAFNPFSSSLRTTIIPFDQSIPRFETSSLLMSVRMICSFVLSSDTSTYPFTVYKSFASLMVAHFSILPNTVHRVMPVASGFTICRVLWK